jgi:FkbM family methyltransferase
MQHSLIYDVGCHKGEDSDFYLKKGFKVVGVEANPFRCKEIKRRFSNQMADGSFVLVEKAIAEQAGEVSFFSNDKVSEWGTTNPEWARKFEYLGASSTKSIVPAVTFSSILEQYGIPYYLKIDIEGNDLLCLKGLLSFSERPQFVSLESEKRSWFALRAEMNLFEQLGYSKFKIVDQGLVPLQKPPNPPREGQFVDHQFELDSSGLFGKELPGPWLTRRKAQAKYRSIFLNYWLAGDFGILLKLRGLRRLARHFPVSWFDTHAALDA